MPTISETAPVRHGIARLTLQINGNTYGVSPQKPSVPRWRGWSLRSARNKYQICFGSGLVTCSCPDQFYNNARCKHIAALQALRLVPRSARLLVAPGEAKGGA